MKRLISIVALVIFCASTVRGQALIKYITPDAGAPGMTVAVEVLGDATATQPFGPDSAFYFDLVQLTDITDTNRVIVGPQVVSWSGRLIQFMLFIKPNATVGSIGLTVKGGANSTQFSIVDPLDLGILTGNITLVAGQSRRNTIVVDSLVLLNGTFHFPSTDTDPSEPGNQSYLPVRLLSVGPIRLINATVDVSGGNASTGSAAGNGGPGGGGGGAGMPGNGGSGFTGGGGVGEQSNHNLRHGGEGTGPSGSHYYDGGSSLNNVRGGEGTEHGNPLEGNDEGGGGGTGHPFGTSGSHGLYKLDSPPGGHGGGSAGGTSTASGTNNYGGGGGGYETQGVAGGGVGDNGGLQVGSAPLIPLAGGSGGGAGNVSYAFAGAGGSAGGGGGAIDMTSFSRFEFISGSITARGGNGSAGVTGLGENGAGGGGGSGGAIVIAARDSVLIGNTTASPRLDVNGGSGGSGYKSGGPGGVGHIRIDGAISSMTGNADRSYFTIGRDFLGAAIERVTFAPGTFTVYGSTGDFDAGRWNVQVLYRFPSDPTWYSVETFASVVPGRHTGAWTVGPLARPSTNADSEVYVLATVEVGSGTAPFLSWPVRTMAHVGGYIARPLRTPESTLSATVLDFGVVAVGSCKDSFIVITNTGTAPLTISQETIGDPRFTALDALPITIAPAGKDTLHLRFCPYDESTLTATDQITSNAPSSPQSLTLTGRGKKYVASSTLSQVILDFGLVKVGSCKDSFVVVTSNGDVPLVITKETISDPRFTALDPLPKTIAAGRSDTLHIRFCPTDTNAISGSDRVESNASQSPQTITLLGKGKKPMLSVQSQLDFGNVAKGTCKDTSMFVRNVGNDTLTITDETLANPRFTATGPSLPRSIAQYDSALFTFRYCSIDTGSETSAGQLIASDTGRFTLLAHTSLGTVRADSAIDLGCVIVGSSASATAYFRNTGNAPIQNVTATVASGAGLQVISNPSSVLGAHSIDSVIVELTPSTAGAFTGVVHISWTPTESSEPSSADILVTAHVSNPPKVDLIDSAIDFGIVPVGNSSGEVCFRITNYSCKPIRAESIVFSGSGAFRISSSDVPIVLVDSQTARVCVTFTPTHHGSDSAIVRIASGADTSAPVTLRGSGLAPITSVILALDTVYGQPGDVVMMHARIVNDVSIAGITSLTFRVAFDPMQLDLRAPIAPKGSIAPPSAASISVTDHAYSLGDHEITVTSSTPLTGAGVIAELPFEILLPTANTAAVSISNATFGASRATLSESAAGMVTIEQCDTTERIQLQSAKVSVSQNAPNPFNPRTTVRLDVRTPGFVTMRVLNVLGQEVARPFSGPLSEGTHSVVVDATGYPSGVYRYIVDWTDGTITSKPIVHWMTVTK